MNKDNYAYIIMGVVILLVIVVMAPRYIGTASADGQVKTNSDIERIEVIHFHLTSQCYSCITMGDLTEETLNTYFSKELNSGKITFEHINIDLSENSEKVEKYEATGSSLLIGTYYSDGSFSKEQNTNVWYKINDKEDFLKYFKGVIEKKLSGN
ncbi:MAG: nitrophenyl compound nitroreductase subunit ArsF family protein [Nanoarchaeota archaeon]|nr:nitrophenyl compound nitroreductase subunit ArsF family protein [Nanoarchaeota archaeon]